MGPELTGRDPRINGCPFGRAAVLRDVRNHVVASGLQLDSSLLSVLRRGRIELDSPAKRIATLDERGALVL